jgi:DnaK suppressor protein
LLARQAELGDRLAVMRADLVRMQDAAVDANLDDEHDPEGATVAFERSQLTTMIQTTAEELTEAAQALDRVAQGRYGRCERCAQPIGAARLEARPATRLCVSCAARRSPS